MTLKELGKLLGIGVAGVAILSGAFGAWAWSTDHARAESDLKVEKAKQQGALEATVNQHTVTLQRIETKVDAILIETGGGGRGQNVGAVVRP